jgi:hypothetical protein
MKRTLILLLLLLLVVGVYYVIGEKPEEETTINVEDRDFKTKDRDAVGTITIKTKGRPLTHLSRKKNEEWYLNNTYKANQRIAANMLGALSAMTIQYIPNKLENQTALDRMDMHGIEIKTYDYNGNVLTDFILGTNINTEYGTYFRRANAKQCYVMSIPASPGGLRNYFTQTKEDLRDMTVFAYEPDNIKKVTKAFHLKPNFFGIGIDLNYIINKLFK